MNFGQNRQSLNENLNQNLESSTNLNEKCLTLRNKLKGCHIYKDHLGCVKFGAGVKAIPSIAFSNQKDKASSVSHHLILEEFCQFSEQLNNCFFVRVKCKNKD
jgi:hypothetical protein